MLLGKKSAEGRAGGRWGVGCWCNTCDGWAEAWAFITSKRLSVVLAGLSHPTRKVLRMQ